MLGFGMVALKSHVLETGFKTTRRGGGGKERRRAGNCRSQVRGTGASRCPPNFHAVWHFPKQKNRLVAHVEGAGRGRRPACLLDRSGGRRDECWTRRGDQSHGRRPRGPGSRVGVGREQGRAWKDDGQEGDSRPRSTARCAAPAGTLSASSPTRTGPKGRLRHAQTNGAAVPAETWTRAAPKAMFEIHYKS